MLYQSNLMFPKTPIWVEGMMATAVGIQGAAWWKAWVDADGYDVFVAFDSTFKDAAHYYTTSEYGLSRQGAKMLYQRVLDMLRIAAVEKGLMTEILSKAFDAPCGDYQGGKTFYRHETATPQRDWILLARIPSRSTPGKTYEVKKNVKDGRFGCNCPAYIFQRGKVKGDCGHIKKDCP